MNRLLQLLNLRRNEVPRLGLAAATFFLVQVDDGIVKSVAQAVFNIRAGVEQLPLMYTWIAVLFSLSMALLSWLTAKLSRQRLLFGLLAGVAAVLVLNTGCLYLEHRLGGPVLGESFYSFLFISSELARSLLNFQIWIVAGGICYTSRAKVLFPLLASSAVLGDIAGGFAVRLLGAWLVSYQLYALAALNMALIIVLLRRLVRRYFVVQQSSGEEEGASLGENLRYFGRSTYLRLLFLLSIAVFALYTGVHYGFNVVGRQHYPSEAQITEFFGLFFGLTGLATLVVTTFLLQRLLRWLGTGNIYMWVCLIYAAVALVAAGSLEGYVLLPVVGVVFAANLLSYLLLDSVVAPAYQVLIKLVPQRNSDGTRMVMEGGFMLLGGLAGAGLTAMHARHWVSLPSLFALLALLALAMVLAGWLLRRSYTQVLVRAVREQDIDVGDEQAMQSLRKLIASSTEFPRSLLLHRDDGVRQMGIEILRQHPQVAAQVCLPLTGHANPRIRSAALEALSADGAVEEAIQAVLPGLDDADREVRLSASRALARFFSQADPGAGRARQVAGAIEPRLQEAEGDVRLQAEFLVILEELKHSTSEPRRRVLLEGMLESSVDEALIAGVQVAGRTGAAWANLRLVALLEHAHPAVREAAVRALGQLQHRAGLEALMDRLGDPDPDVVGAVVEVLGKVPDAGLKALMVAQLEIRPLREWEGLLAALVAQEDEKLTAALMASCRARLVEACRYLVAVERLRAYAGMPALELLVDQLENQNLVVQNGAVRLLGYLGDVGVVGDLLERLSGDDPEARSNAVELLENIADRELLRHLLPLLEGEAQERGALARPISGWESVDVDEVLRHALRARDRWTQMAAVWAAVALERLDLVGEVGAGLAAEATGILEEIEAKKGRAHMEGEHLPLTTMEKITFLKESSFFAALPLEELYQIALSMEEESARAGQTVIREGTLGDKMYIVVRGVLEVKKGENLRVAELGEKQVFGEMALLDDEPRSASVVALEDAHLLSLQRSSLERILRRYSSIAFSMMRILSRRLRDSMAA